MLFGCPILFKDVLGYCKFLRYISLLEKIYCKKMFKLVVSLTNSKIKLAISMKKHDLKKILGFQMAVDYFHY